jgi:hypothetical protein
MDYTRFIKKLELQAGAAPPTRLTYDNLAATAIRRAHLQDDVAGINASIELIQRTRGGRWPTGPVTEEHNYVDLVGHEAEFRDGSSFTYAVYESDKRYLGCCYLSPLGRRTTLTEGLLAYDVDVSWWVTPPPTGTATTRSSTPPSSTGSPASSPFGSPTTRTRRSPANPGAPAPGATMPLVTIDLLPGRLQVVLAAIADAVHETPRHLSRRAAA